MSGFLKYAVREEINRSASRGPSKISLACSSSRKLSSAKQPYCVFPKCLTRVVLPIWRAPVTIKAFFVGEFFHLASSSHIFRLSIKASSPGPSRFSLFFRTVCHVFLDFYGRFVTFFRKHAEQDPLRCGQQGKAFKATNPCSTRRKEGCSSSIPVHGTGKAKSEARAPAGSSS